LIFVVAVPQRLVNDYLVPVGKLARITQNEHQALLVAATAAEFIDILCSAASF
jgi:hypothetical protein